MLDLKHTQAHLRHAKQPGQQGRQRKAHDNQHARIYGQHLGKCLIELFQRFCGLADCRSSAHENDVGILRLRSYPVALPSFYVNALVFFQNAQFVKAFLVNRNCTAFLCSLVKDT